MLKGAIVEKLGKLGLPNLGKCQTIEDYVNSLNKGLLSLVTKQNRQSAKDLEWTSIGSDMDIIISSKPFAKGKDALLDIGRKFQGFRSWDRRGHFENKAGIDHDHTFDYFDTQLFGNEKDKNKATLPIPERSAFGMPYTQSFSSLKRKLNSEKLPAITFTPEWVENGNKTTGRRASPLFFKIVKIDTKSEQFFWQVVYLPSRFLPEGAKIKVEGTYLKKKEFINPPMEYGVPQNPENPKDTLIMDFLTWLKGNPDVPEVIPRVTSVPPSGKVRDNHPKSNFSNKLDMSELNKKLKKR
jgi:hypothetical protein